MVRPVELLLHLFWCPANDLLVIYRNDLTHYMIRALKVHSYLSDTEHSLFKFTVLACYDKQAVFLNMEQVEAAMYQERKFLIVLNDPAVPLIGLYLRIAVKEYMGIYLIRITVYRNNPLCRKSLYWTSEARPHN